MFIKNINNTKKPANKMILTVLIAVMLLMAPISVIAQTTADMPVSAAEPTDVALSSEDKQVAFRQELEKLTDIFYKIYANFAGEIDVNKLFEAAINSALRTIDDRHTDYFAIEEYEKFLEEVDGEFVGIGVEIKQQDGVVTVVRPIFNSPAEEAGIIAGDIITEVDGVSITDLTLDEVVAKVKGPEGSTVVITVNRAEQRNNNNESAGELNADDSQQLYFTLKRQKIEMQTVEGKLIGDLGYLRIDTFGDHTTEHFNFLLERLTDEAKQNNIELQGLILDVRNNSGGRFDTLVEIADIFLDAKTITRIIDKDNRLGFYHTNPGANDIPLVLLVNGASASASELLAGALQDNKRATIIGVTTYGKGTVQNVIEVAGGGHIKVTVARYLTPKGHTVDGKGITPDYYIEYPLAQLLKAAKILSPKTEQTLRMVVNSEYVEALGEGYYIDAIPFKEADEIYVPYRFLIEVLGGTTDWNDETRVINSTINEKTIELDEKKLKYPLIIRDYRSFISLTDAKQLLGIQYEVKDSHEIYISMD